MKSNKVYFFYELMGPIKKKKKQSALPITYTMYARMTQDIHVQVQKCTADLETGYRTANSLTVESWTYQTSLNFECES